MSATAPILSPCLPRPITSANQIWSPTTICTAESSGRSFWEPFARSMTRPGRTSRMVTSNSARVGSFTTVPVFIGSLGLPRNNFVLAAESSASSVKIKRSLTTDSTGATVGRATFFSSVRYYAPACGYPPMGVDRAWPARSKKIAEIFSSSGALQPQ